MTDEKNAAEPSGASGGSLSTGWVIETCETWNGERHWWRNGHGWMRTLRQATVFTKKNAAISKCVQMTNAGRVVREITFSTGRAIYPTSRAE